MEVLGLCTYPLEAACTRYRLIQFIEPLAEKGITLTVSPLLTKDEFASLYRRGQNLQKAARLLNSARKRLFDSVKARKFDAIIVQREAMLAGPPIFEWLYKTIGNCPLVLDLDDATYLSYVSPTYGRLGSALKFFGKTNKLIDWAETVICGNRHIAEYVESRNKRAVIIPTVVDTDKFYPVNKNENKPPVFGWIGTHSTFPSLADIFPVLEDLAKKFDFQLKIIGAGKDEISVSGVRVENLEWSLEREIEDFQSLDIGLYPIQILANAPPEWIAGKSGFKAIQYMAIGIPFVMTPVGVCAEIGTPGVTHFEGRNTNEWYESLHKLLIDDKLRKEMGENGRLYSLKHYTLAQQTEILARVLKNL